MKRKKALAVLVVTLALAVGFLLGRFLPQIQRELPGNIVYISERSAVCHKDPHCSGMKHYKETTYEEAEGYYRFCPICWDLETIG